MLLCLRNAFSRNKMAVGGQPTFTHRLKSYKGLFPTQEESRKHRSEEDLELRKRKREEQVSLGPFANSMVEVTLFLRNSLVNDVILVNRK